MPLPGLELGALEALYDRHRYIDAWAATRPLWSDASVVERMAPRELVFAGRLASRLGSDKLHRHLFRLALERAPDDPYVVYFASGVGRSRWNLIDVLRVLDDPPAGVAAEPSLAASWHATYGQLLSMVRDFEGAHAAIRRARDTGVERSWIDCCEASVLLAEDRWDDALAVARSGWDRDPGHPAIAGALGRALAQVGRSDEAAALFVPHARDGQSYRTAQVALWHLRAIAERLDGDARQSRAKEAFDLAGRLRELAPLADRYEAQSIAAARVDAALILGDHERMRAEVTLLPSPFFTSVLENLEAHKDAERVLLPYRPVLQKHDTCLPASVAAICEAVDADAVAGALTYGGTSTWRCGEWLRARGFGVAPFVVTPAIARRLLLARLPFVLCTSSASRSHATAVIGLDGPTDTLLIHDPAMPRLEQMLVARLHEGEAPFGPEGIAVAPSPDDPRLRLIDPDATKPHAAFLDWHRAIEEESPRSAEPIARKLAADWPDHPVSRRVAALQRYHDGDPRGAITELEQMLARWPKCVHLHRDLVMVLHATRDTARIRKTLRRIVEDGITPGFRSSQLWQEPPATYMAQLADYVGTTQSGFGEARRLLWLAVTQDPHLAEAHHITGDVLWRRRHLAESLLPYRAAATLADVNDHYARGYADTLRALGRTPEAIDVLRRRIDRLGDKLRGHRAHVTLIDALEDWGEPDAARAAMMAAQAARSDDGELWSWAARFWVRMADWDQARAALARLAAIGSKPEALGATVQIERAAGRWQLALEQCRAWRKEAPEESEARWAELDLTAHAEGRAAALALAERWLAESPGDEQIEEMWLSEARRLGRHSAARALLERRVARNPDDAWAWREIGHDLTGDAELLVAERRDGALPRIHEVVARCRTLAPDEAATAVLAARAAQVSGRTSEALAFAREALDKDPALGWVYERAWDWTAHEPRAEQERLQADLEAALVRIVGAPYPCGTLAQRIAERFGLAAAEQAVERWRAARPNEPELSVALAELWLDVGKTRSHAERALDLTATELTRWPNHPALREVYARACGAAVREADEEAALREIVRRRPLAASVAAQLARLLTRRGDTAAGLELLRAQVERTPLEGAAWDHLVTLEEHVGDTDGSLATLERAVARLPHDVALRERLVAGLTARGDHAKAVEAGRGGTLVHPDGSYMWCLYAEALEAAGAPAGEVEATFRRSLALNEELGRAADGLAMLMASQRRYEDARRLLAPFVARHDVPAAARLAWIDRMAGDKPGSRAAMAELLRRHPEHDWGWSQWMDWIQEDGAFGETRALLAELPPGRGSDPSFSARRLELLRQAGEPAASLDGEWRRLLVEFPSSVTLRLLRIDELLERKDTSAVAPLLDELDRLAPASPFVAARRVHVLVLAGRVQEAIDRALPLWTSPPDDFTWPQQESWRVLAEAAVRTAGRAAVAVMLEGAALRLEVLTPLLERLHDVFDDPKRVLFDLSHRLAAQQPFRAPQAAAVLDRLVDLGASDEARGSWAQNEALYRGHLATWMACSRVLVSKPFDAATLRTWLEGWRERQGVRMWVVANYCLALHRGGGWLGAKDAEQVSVLAETTGDALERLPHDGNARYLAAAHGEALLRMGRDAELLAHVKAHGELLRGAGGWMPTGYEKVPEAVVLFADLLASNGPRAAMRASWRLGRLGVSSHVRWLNREWLHRLQGRMGFIGRAWALFLVQLWRRS